MAFRLSTVKRAVLAAGVAVAFGGATRPALAFDDGYENVFTSVLTAVGVMSPDKAPEIDYRERAPLVVPPKTTLIKPETPGARRTAAWPADPDVIRRRKEAEALRSPVFEFDKSADRQMPREEMMKYRAVEAPTQDLTPSGCQEAIHDMSRCRLTAQEVKREEAGWQAANPDKGEKLVVGAEPDRVYLTQPPKGYMKATKEVAATHEAPVVQKDTSSPLATYIHPSDTKSVDPLNN